jgi:Spy/CpxP family protein refolding chaperone
MNGFLLALPMLMLGFAAEARDTQLAQVSNYAGQEKQSIKSLSPEDIAELRRGGGWGLAKAAELNGVPGPAHLLELKDQIPLDEAQVSALVEIFEQMKAQAIQQGERLIALERELENHFQNRSITDAKLRASLDAIAEARKELRYIHLATHLKTPDILSPEQIEKYNALRGYANPNPCANIPEGHDADMWRKHNGCK